MAIDRNRYYSASAQVTYGVYFLINGAWARVGGSTMYFYTSGPGNPGIVNMSNSEQVTVNYNGPAPSDIRVVIESNDDATSSNITSVPNCTWTAQTNSGTRSATPNGETLLATVRPQ